MTDGFYADCCNLKDRWILYGLMTWSDNMVLNYAHSAGRVLIAAYGKVIYRAHKAYLHNRESVSENRSKIWSWFEPVSFFKLTLRRSFLHVIHMTAIIIFVGLCGVLKKKSVIVYLYSQYLFF